MPDLSGAKIKRKIYSFEIKKRYVYESHYKVKERAPIDRIRDTIKKMLAPKKGEKKAETARDGPAPGGFNFLVMGAAIMVAIIILALAWVYLAVQSVPFAGAFQPPVDKPSIDAMVMDTAILTTGDRIDPSHQAALLIDYDARNLNNLTVNLTTYDKRIPSEVFVLVSGRSEETRMYPEFVRDLRADLAKRQILLNEISVKELSTLPEGAIVIVPSGAIPKELLGFDSPITMDKLGDRGVVVVYIGQPFTYMLNGSLSVLTPQDTLRSIPVTFDESADLRTSGGFHLKQPLYHASAAGSWSGDMIYGSVSVLTKGDGAFVFVPQTLDSGWENASIAAQDISSIVFETPWAKPNSDARTYLFSNMSQFAGTRYFFSNTFKKPDSTIKVEFIGYPSSSNNTIRETMIARAQSETGNILVLADTDKVIPFNITGQSVRMNARLHELVASQPDMSLVLYDTNDTRVQDFPQGPVNVQSDKSFDPRIDVPQGEYVVRLMDDSDHMYAQTYMEVVTLDIVYTGQDPKKHSLYNFKIMMGDEPYNIPDLSLSVDKGKYGTFKYNDVDSIQVEVTGTGGESMPQGNHSFDFTAGQFKETVYVVHQRNQTIFDNPLFWGVGLFTLFIVGIGIFFARQEETFFSIDIPDFPPVARTRIPLSPDAVISIFAKLNDTYRWQNTPLTASEVKNGFKDIFYQGKPIIITDYNVEYLLDELEKKGRVKEALGYYGQSEWVDKTKRSMDYMALMRRLRDICVNNAIPFTGIGESKEADSVITVVGQQMFVHFYDKSVDPAKIMSEALSTISKGITIILFKNPYEKDAFQNLLASSSSSAPLIAKMEADGGALQFLAADEFEKMLLEFKSM